MNRVSRSDLEQMIALAREGDGKELGRLLELYRQYLGMLVRLQVGRRLQGKVDASDVVQETFLQAHRGFAEFRGTCEGELLLWLRGIVASKITNLVRHYFGTQRRDVRLAEALDHAHEEGVIHRDVKPSDLILDARGKVWVTDFGLARVESDPGLTMTGDLLGTLGYMSPEQALGKRIVLDHRTDVYSLGASLYELLTLQPVFPGEDREDLLRRIAFEEPKPPRSVNKAIAADLETIVLKSIAKEPAERYATAGDLADDLQRFLADEPIRPKRPTLLKRAAKWSRRHQAVVWSAVAILLLATTGLGVSNLLTTWEKNAKDIALQGRDEALTEKQEALDRATDEAAKAKAVVDLLQEMLGSANPYAAKGADYTVRELLDEFSAGLESQLQDQPEVEAAYVVRGFLYSALKQYDKAAADCEKAIESDPRDSLNEGSTPLVIQRSRKELCLPAKIAMFSESRPR